MQGHFEQGEDFAEQATHTDKGIPIVTHALHGDGCPIVEVDGIPHDKIQSTPFFLVNDVKFVFSHTDPYTGRLQFRRFDFVPVDTSAPSPVLVSELDLAATSEYDGDTVSDEGDA